MKKILYKSAFIYHQSLSDAYSQLVNDSDLTTPEQDDAFTQSLYHQKRANYWREKYAQSLTVNF